MSDSQHVPERRQFKRISFQADVFVVTGTVYWRSRQLDISMKGALVEVPEACRGEVGTPCRLELRLGRGGPVIRMETTMAHRSGALVGLACQNIDVDSLSHLKRLVELNLADEELLQRELEVLVAAASGTDN